MDENNCRMEMYPPILPKNMWETPFLFRESEKEMLEFLMIVVSVVALFLLFNGLCILIYSCFCIKKNTTSETRQTWVNKYINMPRELRVMRNFCKKI